MAAALLSRRTREAQSAAKPSRRVLLGVAVALPLVGGIGVEVAPPPAFASGFGGSPSPSKLGEDWGKALAAFEAAQAAVWEIEAATAGYGFEDEEALLPAHWAACEAMEAALGRLMLVPAPHLMALGVKFEAAFDHELKSAPDDDLRFTALLQDIIRLHSA